MTGVRVIIFVHPFIFMKIHIKGAWDKSELQIVSFDGPYEANIFDPFTEDASTSMRRFEPGQRVFPCFYEQQAYNIQIKALDGDNIQFYHENKYIREAVTDFAGILSGNINFKNDIGFSEFQILSDGKPLLKIKLEVFPAKIDYRRDFQELLKEVNEEIYNLAYDFLRRTFFSADVTPSSKQSLGEFFHIIRLIFSRLLKALGLIKNNPHHKIITIRQVNCPEKAKRFNHQSVKWLSTHPEVLLPGNQNCGLYVNDSWYYPQKIQENKKTIIYDTLENQFVKWVLKTVSGRLLKLCQEYHNLYATDNSRYDSSVDEGLRQMLKKLQQFTSLTFLTGVSEISTLNNISLVLQMAPGYRELYRYYLMLMKGLSIQSDVFQISLKDMSVLYEYWCFLTINRLLRKKYRLKKNNLVKVNKRGLIVTLRQDKRAGIAYENPQTGETFSLSYQERTIAPTVTQVPDNVLSLRKTGSEVDYKYIFDAKYRINPALDQKYAKKYGKPGPEEDDINTMHRYRDSIIFGSKDSRFERSVFGAYVMFPYANEDYYSGKTDGRPHKFFESINLVNIGGVPFLPGHTKVMEQLLDELILDTPETAIEKALIYNGTEHYYYNKFLRKNVFVGPLRNNKQWDISYVQKFYHTPLRNVGNVLGSLEYVAVYQSKKLFAEQCGINYYGKIKGYEIRPRNTITEIPSNSSELYVYFQIEDWLKLPESIKPLNYGIYNRMFTTLPLLLGAAEIPELSLKDETEVRLWKELRRLVPGSQVRVDSRILDEANVAEFYDEYTSIRLEKDLLVVESQAQNNMVDPLVKTIFFMI